MLKLIFSFNCIFCVTFLAGQNQSQRFTDLANSVYFNILTNKPDSSAKYFFKKYATYPVTEFVQGWTDYPPLKTRRQISVHSYVFNKHPFLPELFSNGKFEVTTLDTEGKIQILDLMVKFSFKNNDSADKAYQYFVDRLSETTSKKTNITDTLYKKAEFINEKSTFLSNKVQVIEAKDLFFDRINTVYFFFTKE